MLPHIGGCVEPAVARVDRSRRSVASIGVDRWWRRSVASIDGVDRWGSDRPASAHGGGSSARDERRGKHRASQIAHRGPIGECDRCIGRMVERAIRLGACAIRLGACAIRVGACAIRVGSCAIRVGACDSRRRVRDSDLRSAKAVRSRHSLPFECATRMRARMRHSADPTDAATPDRQFRIAPIHRESTAPMSQHRGSLARIGASHRRAESPSRIVEPNRRAESPTRIADPNRRSESSCRIVVPNRRAESPSRIAEPNHRAESAIRIGDSMRDMHRPSNRRFPDAASMS